ncbi:MAG: SDR family NAD(P)-dependent oxidoreductase [Planctomycetota bacterium]
MKKKILITGATDGIGLGTAELCVSKGHTVLLHGRSAEKLTRTESTLRSIDANACVENYLADLSDFTKVADLADAILDKHQTLDVVINNAGVFSSSTPMTHAGLDIRFMVNTIAPYFLTRRLATLIGNQGRVVNLSSAAQAPVDLEAFRGNKQLSAEAAYAQSKLALTMWSHGLATEFSNGPTVIAVNPGSFLGSKMVKEAFGMEGKDIQIGARIVAGLAVEEKYASASGLYFDNDIGRFCDPHPDAMNSDKIASLMTLTDSILGAG